MSHLFLGRLYYLMRRETDAVREFSVFKEKMALLPKMDTDTKKMYIGNLRYISSIYLTLKMHPECLRTLGEILRLDPKYQDGHYDLGVYYYMAEHSRSKAYDEFKKTLELDPGAYTGKKAKYAIEYIRANPDSRVVADFSFINSEYRDVIPK